jgi:hypothetical protein
MPVNYLVDHKIGRLVKSVSSKVAELGKRVFMVDLYIAYDNMKLLHLRGSGHQLTGCSRLRSG